MGILNRIADDATRSLAPIRGPKVAGDRFAGGRGDVHGVETQTYGVDGVRLLDDNVEVLGARGGRGKPVVSLPSSAFFAQHLGQHPEFRNVEEEFSFADIAYRDAMDLGVSLDRPTPLSFAV